MKKVTVKCFARDLRTGTSFVDECPQGTRVADLLFHFGEPNFTLADSSDGNVQVCWVLLAKNGAALTVYDYKSHKPVEALEGRDLHIGGVITDKRTKTAVRELKALLAR